MKRAHFSLLYAVALLVAMSAGCHKESNPANPGEEVEHPPATSFTFVLLGNDGATVVDTCLVRDTTLVKGLPALVGRLDLVAGQTYKGTLRMYDESVTPTKNINQDIISEAEAHVFVYTDAGSRITFSNLDKDDKGLTFGLNFTLTVSAGSAASGAIHVILQHHDDGVKFNTNGSYHEPYDLDIDADVPYSITQ